MLGIILRGKKGKDGGGGVSTPTGTGFPHVTSGAQDAAARLVHTGDILAKAVTLAKIQDLGVSKLLGSILGGVAVQIDLDADGTLAADSDSKVATQKAVKTFIGTAIAGLIRIVDDIDCSGNPNYPAAVLGEAYRVSVAGKVGGASGVAVDVGDLVIASADNAGGTQAAVGTSWFILEHNGEYDTPGDRDDAIAAAIAALGTASALIADTDPTLAADSDANAATQKAVKAYIDAAIAALGTASALDADTDPTLAADSDANAATQKAVKAYVDALAAALGSAAALDADTDPTLAADSDAVIPTQKAIKTYVDDAIAAGSPPSGVFEISGFINNPLVKNIPLSINFPRPATILSFTGKCASGTVTLDINIGGTVVTGLGAQTFDVSGETNDATALQDLIAGNMLNMNFTGVAAGVDFSYTMLLQEAG